MLELFLESLLKIVLKGSLARVHCFQVIVSYIEFESYPGVWFKSCYSYSKMWSNFWKKKDIGFQKIKKCTQIEMLLKEKKFQKLIEKNMVPGNMTVTKANVSHRRNITYSTKNIIYLYNVLKTFGRFQENNSGWVISTKNSCSTHSVSSLKKSSNDCVFLRNCRKMDGSGRQFRTAAFDVIQSHNRNTFQLHSFMMYLL